MAVKTTKPAITVKALVLRAAGTNCDQETIHALKAAGADSDLVHVNQILNGRVRLHPYHMLIVPGGFSYGDDISAGKVLANELRLRLKDQLTKFVESKKLIIGICNGFQVLVKAGLLPGVAPVDEEQTVTLGLNDSARFQCEWIGLKVEKSAASWLNVLPPAIELPIAHGEGKFITASPKVFADLKKNKQVVFRYAPRNPNGSEDAIAGICNSQGNVIGLMPHPERFLSQYQHPNWTARKGDMTSEWGDGFWFWKQAVSYAESLTN
jgi:phosphoribosylformylglycinamidine synthase subunit PurQ / glutaminase